MKSCTKNIGESQEMALSLVKGVFSKDFENVSEDNAFSSYLSHFKEDMPPVWLSWIARADTRVYWRDDG